MYEQQILAVTRESAAFHPLPALRLAPRTRARQHEERLPFSIRLVQSESELDQAISIRHAAYARHLPELGEKLKDPEALDFDANAAVLLAVSKFDGAPLGTARIQTNATGPLCVEQSVTLPAHLAGLRLAEVTRLGVEGGRIGRLVKVALVKACFQYCEIHGVDWAIAAGRAPIDQMYEQLLFADLFPEQGFIPMRHAGDIPHRVMGFEIATGQVRWETARHPLLNFFCDTDHPDICIPKPLPEPTALRRPEMVRMPGRLSSLHTRMREMP